MRTTQAADTTDTTTTSTQETFNSDYSNDKQLIQREEIPNTPFIATKWEGKWYLNLGKYVLTPPCDTLDEIYTQLEERKWTIMLSLASIVYTEAQQNNPLHQITPLQ